ncbi:transcription elongation factor TFIIS [Cryptosporidium ryanae]|uniref:transcription elongation factor TFIIS n=1 Tax=Cryptosporidium ryanae TaxID=515981 RepID=UPI00351A9B6C|nr:transcription elongation factor TFIIS [Cryptosporidium ryanae]
MNENNDLIEKIRSIKEELEQLSSKTKSDSASEYVLKLLSDLDDFDVDREILKTTKIGVVMTLVKKSFCKVNNISIVTKADELIKKWKQGLALCGKKSIESEVVSNEKDFLNQAQTIKCLKRKLESEENVDGIKVESMHKEYKGPLTGDTHRDKARTFLWKAIVTGVPPSQAKLMKEEQVCELAAEIETVLYKEYIVKGDNSVRDYNLQLKTIKWNLSDLKNPELNSKLYVGKITPEELARMESKDMASEAKQKEREKHKKESLEACQSDWDLRNLIQKEGQFTCGKCKTNKTTYNQMQTRSADEPMTTFVRCLNCNNRWRF